MNKRILLILFLILISYSFMVQAAQTEYWVVNATNVNLRQGAGLEFDIIRMLNKDERVNVLSQLGNWSVVQTSDKLVGVISSKYIKKTTQLNNTNKTSTSILTQEEKQLLDYINAERQKQKLNPLIVDESLAKVARLKADDMTKNNYFGHTSKIYGSHFDMIKKYNIKNKVSGENISGNKSVKDAFNAFIKSSKDKKNIISKTYNYIGIGVCDNSKYGKMIVLEFVGR